MELEIVGTLPLFTKGRIKDQRRCRILKANECLQVRENGGDPTCAECKIANQDIAKVEGVLTRARTLKTSCPDCCSIHTTATIGDNGIDVRISGGNFTFRSFPLPSD